MPKLGPGPVFVYEVIAAAHRRSTYSARAAAVLALLLTLSVGCLFFLWEVLGSAGGGGQPSIRAWSQIGTVFYISISLMLVTLALLAAPAATAGSVCLDRARGDLVALMVTDLSDVEVVLGKLLGRIVPVASLTFAAIPVLALAGLLGGVELESLASLVTITLCLSLLVCALALALSVRMSRPHEVLTVVYALFTLWAIWPLVLEVFSSGRAPQSLQWIYKLHPYILAWSPYVSPGYVSGWDVSVFAAVMIGFSALFVLDAVRQLRREPGRRGVLGRRLGIGRLSSWLAARWPGPGLDPNPVLWREVRRSRPSFVIRLVWFFYFGFSAVGTFVGVAYCLAGEDANGVQLISSTNMLSVFLGLLILSATAPTTLTEERVRGSLDVLMTTPMSTRSIVAAKWWGAYRIVPWLAVLPAIGSAVSAATAPDVPKWFVMAVTPAGTTTKNTQTFGPALSVLERFMAGGFPVLSVLSHGAIVAGVGLLLATWIRKPGRAMAVSVGLYVFTTVGTLVLLEMGLFDLVLQGVMLALGVTSFNGQRDSFATFAVFDFTPLGGVEVPMRLIRDSFSMKRESWWPMLAAGRLFTLLMAAVPFLLTLAAFDRCLGRVPERPRRAPKPPRKVRAKIPAPHRRPANASITEPLSV
ncbi:MAG: ABC transporter permease subunit [Isosphaeraceae bacterium]